MCIRDRYHLYGLNQQEGFWGINDGVVDLGAIRGTAPLAIRAAEILGVDADLRDKWREFLKHLPPYPMGRDPGSQALGRGMMADDVWSVGHLGDVKRGGNRARPWPGRSSRSRTGRWKPVIPDSIASSARSVS